MPSQEYQALISSLEFKAEPSAAARTFTEPTRKAFSGGADIESTLDSSWKSLIEVAADTQHESQESLVNIVRAIQQETLTADGATSVCKIWGEEVKVWQDLPLLGPAIREAWNRAPGTGSKDDFSANQWTNLNAFIARLTSLSSSIPAFDFSLYAIWTLRSALEGTNDATPGDVEVAKVWFLYAKETIESLSKEGKAFDGKIARAGDKYKEKDWKGFTTERFGVWKTALQ